VETANKHSHGLLSGHLAEADIQRLPTLQRLMVSQPAE
jgi:hypothetical protein